MGSSPYPAILELIFRARGAKRLLLVHLLPFVIVPLAIIVSIIIVFIVISIWAVAFARRSDIAMALSP